MLPTDCLFCKIVSGKIPCYKVYEDATVFAFLDIHPIHIGHTLVIPKKHYSSLADFEESDLHDTILAVKRVAAAVRSGTKATGINIGMNNDKAAGQLVLHAHFHVIPRFDGDGLKHWPGKEADESTLKKTAAAIVKAL
ncbi:MAG TPA: HIT family protein [Candidatus Nanoarchaeia archaeon]|nr:HIT family protein [Candidatus Nanoarchaeia archaeon]